jgi:hypothetical protein
MTGLLFSSALECSSRTDLREIFAYPHFSNELIRGVSLRARFLQNFRAKDARAARRNSEIARSRV